MTSRRYPPVGKCIYCQRDGVPLSDEHIIPYGLNGDFILPKASCRTCADVTSGIERELLRGEMRQVRAALSFRSRRPSQIPKTFPLDVTRGGVEKTIDAQIADHPIILPLPLYKPPAALNAYDYTKGIAFTGFQALTFGPSAEQLLKRHVAEHASVTIRLDQNLFARLLAKIAYSFAVAHLGIDRVPNAFVLPTIFGDMSQTGKWIGSSDKVLPAEAPDVQHAIRMQTFEGPDDHRFQLLQIVTLKLFANCPSPGYVITVGGKESSAEPVPR